MSCRFVWIRNHLMIWVTQCHPWVRGLTCGVINRFVYLQLSMSHSVRYIVLENTYFSGIHVFCKNAWYGYCRVYVFTTFFTTLLFDAGKSLLFLLLSYPVFTWAGQAGQLWGARGRPRRASPGPPKLAPGHHVSGLPTRMIRKSINM